MRWMKVAGFVFIFGLVAACKIDAKTPNQCQADEQCPEGAYCDVGRALCVLACEKAGCLEGHFCDPDSHYCKDYCPHACPVPPANATLLCGEVCVYACNDGFRECEGHKGECLSDSSDPTACGASCEDLQVCTAPANGAAACSDGVCGYACNDGFHLCGDRCVSDTDVSSCGTSCTPCAVPANGTATCNGGACGIDCTENGTVTGMIYSGGACVQTERFSRNTSVLGYPVVKDRDTGLIWQGCAAGLTGNKCDEGAAVPMTWWSAADDDESGYPDIDYCRTLNWGGYNTGWRLPTQLSSTNGELNSILLNTCPGGTSPCIDTVAFPATPLEWFWGSSYAIDSTTAWLIHITTHQLTTYNKDYSLGYVRCVRSGP